MTSPRLHLIHDAQPSQPSAQTGCSKEFRVISGGRRRRRSDAEVMRADLPILWQRFVRDVFGDGPGARTDTALAFGCTLQTACNWHDGFVGPMGHAVAHATQAFPEEYDAIFRPDRQRRAA
jgi:hypothetical protein